MDTLVQVWGVDLNVREVKTGSRVRVDRGKDTDGGRDRFGIKE